MRCVTEEKSAVGPKHNFLSLLAYIQLMNDINFTNLILLFFPARSSSKVTRAALDVFVVCVHV